MLSIHIVLSYWIYPHPFIATKYHNIVNFAFKRTFSKCSLLYLVINSLVEGIITFTLLKAMALLYQTTNVKQWPCCKRDLLSELVLMGFFSISNTCQKCACNYVFPYPKELRSHGLQMADTILKIVLKVTDFQWLPVLKINMFMCFFKYV